MSLGGLLNRTCTITRPGSGGAAGYGGQPEGAPVTVASGVPCRVSSYRGRQTTGDREVPIQTPKLTLDYGADLKSRDTVTLDDGTQWMVDGPVNNAAGMNHHVHCALKRTGE